MSRIPEIRAFSPLASEAGVANFPSMSKSESFIGGRTVVAIWEYAR